MCGQPYYKQNVLSGNVPGFDDLVLPSTRLAEEAKEAFESAMPAVWNKTLFLTYKKRILFLKVYEYV